jgi:hypothetical protein
MGLQRRSKFNFGRPLLSIRQSQINVVFRTPMAKGLDEYRTHYCVVFRTLMDLSSTQLAKGLEV